ncbi:rubrerythrin-like domain-containing protein [Natribaculum luteum]|uniref:Rubrerythrin-like domain-containing protein n=1 Tax=Natribaculum luteum TaxID=1586232 RepID=A0ABD5NVJ7_9EURY|nr:rubrerythrin-like domain-containing protein [Natribaculum luteum]
MAPADPYTPSGAYYECHSCGYRGTAAHTPGSCPKCSSSVKNIGVPQE